jgi:tRNA(fMet)-specific endonuclease VapC
MGVSGAHGWGTDKRNAVALMLDNMVTIDINDRTVIDSYVEMARASQRLPGGARVLSNNDLWIAACTRAAAQFC